jgi:hypothetical protein
MKLWELRPLDKYRERDDPGRMDNGNPWDPWYDRAFGFIVRAETEHQARQLAHENAGDENMEEKLGVRVSHASTPWLNSKYSTCTELLQDGESGIILQDFYSA